MILLRQPNRFSRYLWRLLWAILHPMALCKATQPAQFIQKYERSKLNNSFISYVSSYIANMYRELTISRDVPAPKLTKALKTGKLSLTADQLKGSGSVIHLHPTSYEKVIKACKAGLGVRLDNTRHEIKKDYKRAQGGSIWSKIKSGLSSAFKLVKDSGLLSRGLDVTAPALATAFGAPQAEIPARAAIKSLTRVVLTDGVNAGEKYLLSKATKPEHEILIKSVRGEVKRRYGVGVPKKKPAKGSPEMKAKMAALRAKRKKPMQAGSFRFSIWSYDRWKFIVQWIIPLDIDNRHFKLHRLSGISAERDNVRFGPS
ncbi:unnamed protein product [Phytophthora lilii]|uniref:Unnamed protein product n=1 Tax=Phytophthora lilii TaxID=2077276 RepID=A0A9W6YIF0_9STRA|nr:unnamed protein product [Phytophthora lilii]